MHNILDNKEKVNLLKITGDFKYFQMHMWLNTIFNDFGPSPSYE
jgi:hypothetical protein